jgi:hypothetical protein
VSPSVSIDVVVEGVGIVVEPVFPGRITTAKAN